MLKRYQSEICGLFRLTDAAVVVGAWLLAYWLRFNLDIIPAPKGVPPFELYAALIPLVAIVWMAVFSFMRVYESRRMVGRAQSLQLLLRAHCMALIVFFSVTYFIQDANYSRGVMSYFAVISALGLMTQRWLLLSGLRALRSRGFNLRRLVAVGEGQALAHVIERLKAFPEFGLRVHGVVTSDKSDAQFVAEAPVLGHFSDIRAIVRRCRVDEVLVALPSSQGRELDQILRDLHDETVDIRLVPDIHQYVALGCEVEDFDGLPVMRINDSPVVGLGGWAKRGTDVVLASLGIAVVSPLLLLIAVLVKVTSPGPVLFVQERTGLDGRSFQMLKFRSMRANAEVESGPTWAKKVDPRRTAFGTFLRKTSLDELPQLWNVIRGDMSLVGPRPERPVFVRSFRKQIPDYMFRHKVRAGITGWAQINGWRGDTSLERRIECDLFYIRNWSYLLDLKILTMTLWKGFINKNAY